MRAKFTAEIRWGSILSVLGLCACSNSTPAASSKSFVWVATAADQKVTSYTIDWQSGAIAAVSSGAPASTGVQPSAIAASNDALNLFIANAGDDTIGIYARQS